MGESAKLKTIFEEIERRYKLPTYLEGIRSIIASGRIQNNELHQVLQKNNINHSVAKVDFLHLFIEYIKIALEDDILTKEERDNINYLKQIFQIHPSDFHLYAKVQTERIIFDQLSKIYQDNLITQEEALLKIEIQEIFDLSFDQMNDYSKSEAARSIKQGADPKDLDIFFTYKEYFKLKNQ